MSECRKCHRKLRQGNVCRRCARSAVKQSSPLAGRKATVYVERNGSGIRIDDVPASQAAGVLADILEAMRALATHYDELVSDLNPVPGGAPVDGDASDFGARKRRVGFIR